MRIELDAGDGKRGLVEIELLIAVVSRVTNMDSTF